MTNSNLVGCRNVRRDHSDLIPAKALGLTMPTALLVRPDEVIE
jgi:hypothetical protein